MIKFSNLTVILSGAFAILLMMMAYVVFDHYVLTQRVNEVITSSRATVLKVRYYSEMMEFARTRTRLTSQILATEEFFEKDTLNQTLEIYAGRFARTFQQLNQLPLDGYEQEQLKKQRAIVSVILPAQREVVSLSMYGDPSDETTAEKLFYETVMAGQNNLIELFQGLIAYNQEQAEDKLSNTSRKLSDALHSQGIIAVVFLLLTILIATIVVSRTAAIHRRLMHDRDTLEDTVTQRTTELQKSYDDLAQALESLKGSEDRYRQIAQISSDWVWEMDENLRFCYFSDSFTPFAHADPSLLLGKTRQDISSKEDLQDPKWQAHLKALEERRSFKDFQYEFSMPGVGSWYFSISGSPVFDEDGKFTGYRGTGTNVTERVKAEQALKLARKEAEAANHAKSEFLSSMSHELRTPLNAIIGFGQLLETDTLSDDQKDSVRQILRSGEHLLGLINDVLDLARIESGNLSMSMEDVDPALALNQSFNMATSMAKKYSVTVRGGPFDGPMPPVRVDQTRLKQVLLNFLSNAIKYNHKGGEVTLACEELDDGFLRFSVADTGPGIPAHMQDKLFTPFNRLNREGSHIEGTGIGLVITQELVAVMGGRIGFTSEEGKGSTFWFDLPIVGKGVAVMPTTDNVFVPKRSYGIGLDGPRRLLYIEDNPANLMLVEKIIDRVPMLTMLSATSAEEGLKMAEEEQPDLILMDINLPGMDGVDAMKALRQHTQIQHIPVVAISAAAMDGDINRGMDAGFEAYLTKPIKVDQLLAAIKTVFRSKGA